MFQQASLWAACPICDEKHTQKRHTDPNINTSPMVMSTVNKTTVTASKM